jgi:hypothetical protein
MRIVLALAILAVFAVPAQAQCQNGQCPTASRPAAIEVLTVPVAAVVAEIQDAAGAVKQAVGNVRERIQTRLHRDRPARFSRSVSGRAGLLNRLRTR